MNLPKDLVELEERKVYHAKGSDGNPMLDGQEIKIYTLGCTGLDDTEKGHLMMMIWGVGPDDVTYAASAHLTASEARALGMALLMQTESSSEVN